jgi:hypothetical protein
MINPITINVNAIKSIVGLNHQNPSSPQYNLLDKAAAVLTLANPNMTKTTLGKQHMLAKNADPSIHLHMERASGSSLMV